VFGVRCSVVRFDAFVLRVVVRGSATKLNPFHPYTSSAPQPSPRVVLPLVWVRVRCHVYELTIAPVLILVYLLCQLVASLASALTSALNRRRGLSLDLIRKSSTGPSSSISTGHDIESYNTLLGNL